MKTFQMPDLGEGLDEAEIVTWHVSVGDHIVAEQPLASVETAKAVVEIPAPWAGKVMALHVQEGQIAKIGAPLCDIETSEPAHDDAAAIVGTLPNATSTAMTPDENKSARPAPVPRAKATPAVRMLAKQLGIDLNSVKGTGPDGAILKQDVERTVHKPGFVPLRGVRRAMAEAISRSASVIPATVTEEADTTGWQPNEEPTIRLVRAIMSACSAVPILNATFDDTQMALRANEAVNIAMAVSTDEGLFSPVIRDAQKMGDEDLRERLQALKQAAASRTLATNDLQGATITLSNFGMMGGLHANLTIVPPQVAIIGAGRRHAAARVKDGEIAVRTVLPLSLTFDHRVITGAEAIRFLTALKDALEKRTHI